MNITKRRVAFVAALVVSVLAIVTVCGLAGCSSCSRSVKSMSSDFSGGINRTVTLYDNTGKEIKSWHGKFAKNPHTTKSAVVEVKHLTCWHNLPHECQPWNRCDFWEPKEAER